MAEALNCDDSRQTAKGKMMKTVQLNAAATREGDSVCVNFSGGSDKTTLKGEVVYWNIGQITMTAEVWELFSMAMQIVHRSRTENYNFETGISYIQPKDDKYPTQHCLEMDSSILCDERLNTVRMGDLPAHKAK